MRAQTIHEQQRLRLLAGAVIARHYSRPLTLASVAWALASSPRQVQRAYARSGSSFSEELLTVRLAAATQLLAQQPGIPVEDVARLVGYRRATHFARAFRAQYGLSPGRYRERAWKATVAEAVSGNAAVSAHLQV